MRITRSLLGCALVLAVVAVPCFTTAAAAATVTATALDTEPPRQSGAAPAAASISDAEILAVLEAISDASINQARSAHERASDRHVKRFAHSVERRNEWAKRRQTQLGKHHKLSAVGGKSVEEFRQSFHQNYRNLEGLARGAEFDRTYINDEIGSLDRIADTIENKLLPQVHLRDLRTELHTVLDEVKHDLKKAHELRERLHKSSK